MGKESWLVQSSRRSRGKIRDERALFLRDFLRRPREVASLVPSSRFLERKLVREADLSDASIVVELGPGTGGTTRACLSALPPRARMLLIEINPRFANLIRTNLQDPRVIVQEGDAQDLCGILKCHGLPAPDVIVSGIPFSTIPETIALGILRSAHDSLAPGGRFIAYQVRDRVEVLGRQVFGRARVRTELLNVPPTRIFRWDKAPLSTDG